MAHTINVPLARRILAQITAAPQRWTQNNWIKRPYDPDQQAPTDTIENCQTSGCFAGWAVVLSGHKTDRFGQIIDATPDLVTRIDTLMPYYLVDWAPGEKVSVRPVAAAELGLDTRQSTELFEASNTLRDLSGCWRSGPKGRSPCRTSCPSGPTSAPTRWRTSSPPKTTPTSPTPDPPRMTRPPSGFGWGSRRVWNVTQID